MAYLSRREIEDLRPLVEKAVYKTLNGSDSSVFRAAIDCLTNGYDKRKISDKLGEYIDNKKATKLAERIQYLLDDIESNRKSKKRSYDDDRDRDSKKTKLSSSKRDDGRESERERDRDKFDRHSKPRHLSDKDGIIRNSKMEPLPPPSKNNISLGSLKIPQASIYGIPSGLLNKGDAEKARKIAQLQAQIKSKLSTGILGNAIQIPVQPNKPQPLILDEDGRTVDKSGKAIQLTHVAPTLKANLRALKREQYREKTDKRDEDNAETRFLDPRIGIKPALRNKRALRFHEPGKFQQLAERLRMKNQLEKLQNEISEIAKKTGISSATKLALIAKSEGVSDDVPDMEWWDCYFRRQFRYFNQ